MTSSDCRLELAQCACGTDFQPSCSAGRLSEASRFSFAVSAAEIVFPRVVKYAYRDWSDLMARTKTPEKFHLSATARTCLKKNEYSALGRHARVKGKTVSALMRDLILAELTSAAVLPR